MREWEIVECNLAHRKADSKSFSLLQRVYLLLPEIFLVMNSLPSRFSYKMVFDMYHFSSGPCGIFYLVLWVLLPPTIWRSRHFLETHPKIVAIEVLQVSLLWRSGG